LNESAIVKTLLWPDEAATQAFAQHLAQCPAIFNAIIALEGDLGAGKTTLVRSILHALGVEGRVKSPTYTIVEPYECTYDQKTIGIWHFDFYRFNDPREWEDAGLRDIFASPGLKLCEWPDHAQGLLPHIDLTIDIQVKENDARIVTLRAESSVGKSLLK
jgi:tRNA threonylcarbamoyladenosine biosynthesis protein TsaE